MSIFSSKPDPRDGRSYSSDRDAAGNLISETYTVVPYVPIRPLRPFSTIDWGWWLCLGLLLGLVLGFIASHS